MKAIARKTAVGVLAAGVAAGPAFAADIDNGAAVFAGNCAACPLEETTSFRMRRPFAKRLLSSTLLEA